jgi:phospholipid/cholesterol/gamma-HCH transport system ATP-binding protein
LLAQADSGQFESTKGPGGRHWAPEADARPTDGQGGSTATAVLPRQGDKG